MGTYKGFSQVELRRPERSTFDLSHEKRISTRIGKLTPVFVSETMPNDTFFGSTEVLLKVAPLLAPIFHRLNLYVHYFFVPYRLWWKEWEPFITGGRVGEAVTAPPVTPRLNVADACGHGQEYFGLSTLADYLGIPKITDDQGILYGSIEFDAAAFFVYQRIWFDYYRDRNMGADSVPGVIPLGEPMESGTIANTAANYRTLLGIRYRAWQHEYFSSALPWTQRGAEVLMPIGGTGTPHYMPNTIISQADGGGAFPNNTLLGNGAAPVNDSNLYGGKTGATATGEAAKLQNIDYVEFDTSDISINDLRQAVALQKWLERNALGGSRYNESIWAHFGRRTSDGRLQRAEYLGGGKAVIQISEVLTTAYSQDDADVTVPPANMAGRGSSYSNVNKFTYNCEEHGMIMGILSVMPTSAYMQGVPRMFLSRRTFLDYPWPTFAHLGEQEVYDYEIYATSNSMGWDGFFETPFSLFGYQSRYADWKTIHSSSHGDFRESLDFWHLTRKFSEPPSLNEEFVTFEDALQDRVFAVSGVDTLWMYVYNNIRVKRSLPYFGTPAL